MVSGLPSTQHISLLCSPSGNPSAAHAKESAQFCPTRSSPSWSNSSLPNRPPSPPPPLHERPWSPDTSGSQAEVLASLCLLCYNPTAAHRAQETIVICSTEIQLQQHSNLSPGRKGEFIGWYCQHTIKGQYRPRKEGRGLHEIKVNYLKETILKHDSVYLSTKRSVLSMVFRRMYI